jgi:dTDP-4-dehydrorhamnose 3,5-epimerase
MQRDLAAAGLPLDVLQVNHSRSTRSVLRGLHFQNRTPQGKLVRALRGEIFDVAVDVRRGSPAFGQWTAVTLREGSGDALWIPPGFAHGFCALSDEVDVVYMCTGLYDREDEQGVLWRDPEIGIEWPLAEPVISVRDRSLPLLSEIQNLPVLNA